MKRSADPQGPEWPARLAAALRMAALAAALAASLGAASKAADGGPHVARTVDTYGAVDPEWREFETLGAMGDEPRLAPLVNRRRPGEEDAIVDYLPLPTYGPDGLELADTPRKTAAVIQIMLFMTVLALAPSILIMLTSFLRIVIVMGFVRKALSTQTLPPDQVLVGLSLLLTFFIMWPTWQASWKNGLMPYWNGEEVQVEPGVYRRLEQKEAFELILAPVRAFMFSCLDGNQGREELFFFLGMYEGERFTPERAAAMTEGEVPTVALIPAFITAELRRAFWMGFLLYLPFLILDMVIASVLMSMGMMMLQPAMISLPFKLVLFVLVDGWRLMMEGLVTSFPADIYGQAFLAAGG